MALMVPSPGKPLRMGAMMRHHENDFKAEVVKVVKEKS
jgi:hypothetical protein